MLRRICPIAAALLLLSVASAQQLVRGGPVGLAPANGSCIPPLEFEVLRQRVMVYQALQGHTDNPSTQFGFFPQAGNLWEDLWVHNFCDMDPAPLLLNIREAFEFAAFALLLGCLRRITGADLRKWEIGTWILFCIALATAFVFRTRADLQNFVVTTPYLLLLLPFCWSRVWILREGITAWALAPDKSRPVLPQTAD